MSSKRTPRTRKDPFFARLIALGKGRFRQAVTGRLYVDSRDMDDYFDEGVDEWENTRKELKRLQKKAQADGRLPPDEVRAKAADDEIETMWHVAAEKSGGRKGRIILP